MARKFLTMPSSITSESSASRDAQKLCKATSSESAMVSAGIHSIHSCSGLLEIRGLPLACCLWGMGIFAEVEKPPVLWDDSPSPASCRSWGCLLPTACRVLRPSALPQPLEISSFSLPSIKSSPVSLHVSNSWQLINLCSDLKPWRKQKPGTKVKWAACQVQRSPCPPPLETCRSLRPEATVAQQLIGTGKMWAAYNTSRHKKGLKKNNLLKMYSFYREAWWIPG